MLALSSMETFDRLRVMHIFESMTEDEYVDLSLRTSLDSVCAFYNGAKPANGGTAMYKI